MSKLKAPGAPANRTGRSLGGLKPPTSRPVVPAEAPAPKQRTPSDTAETTELSFEVGDRVLANGINPGTVEFVGCTQFAKGVWVGVVLDTPDGKNDGSVAGVRYFTSPPNHGLFSRPEKLVAVPRQKNQPPSRSSLSSVGKQSRPPLPPMDNIPFSVGDRVSVDGAKTGTVSFVGPTMFAKGIWAGITLDTPDGKNNGAVAGVQYFECEPSYGVFTRLTKLALLEESPRDNATKRPVPMTAAVTNTPPSNAGSQPVPGARGAPPTGGPSLSAEELRAKAEQLHEGDRILVNGSKEGTLRFIGSTHFAKGIWVGVELDMPQGKNDGAVSGRRYFQCQPQHGLFAPLPKVEKIGDALSTPPSQRAQGGRNLSTSSHSSISSMSSLTKLKQQQLQITNDSGVRGGSPPTESFGGGSEGLSHIMFEKDHLIATLQSSLDQADQEKMSLSQQVTDLQRKVDDLNFRLEEQSVVSGDQLEEVETRESIQLKEIQSKLEKEVENNASLIAGRSALEAAKLQLEEKLTFALNEKRRLEEQTLSSSSSDEIGTLTQKLFEKEREVTEILKNTESLKLENETLKKELKAAEVDYTTAEDAAQQLQATSDSTSQQLQETLELCAQQESLLEEKLNELQTLDEQKRVLERDVERMTLERSQLVASHEQTAAERDRAIAECDRLRNETDSASHEQDSLAQQRRELLQERDRAKAELRDTIQLYEQMKAERDELQIQFEELGQQKQEVQGFSQEMNLKIDRIQRELTNAHGEIEHMKQENSNLRDELEHQKYQNEQKIALADSTSNELKQRLEGVAEERDTALQQAQTLTNRLEKATRERNELLEYQTKYHQQIDELQQKLQEATSMNVYNDQTRAESDAVRQQLEDTEELLADKERKLQEVKEQVVELEEQLIVSSSQAISPETVTALEEANLSLESKVEQLTKQLKAKQSAPQSANDNSFQEERAALQTEIKDKEQEISFLNSVIADLQAKVEALEALNGLGNNAALGYLDTSEEDLIGHASTRLFCDICDEFDLHDTADCPQQTQTDSPPPTTKHHMFRSQERPYCENCEVFGHWTEECDYEETY